MTVAARLGSRDAALAHRTRSCGQYWISFVKMGEIPEGAADELPMEADSGKSNNGLLERCSVVGWLTASIPGAEVGTTRLELSATGNCCVTTGNAGLIDGAAVYTGDIGVSASRAEVWMGARSAKMARRQAMNNAASGGIQYKEKQPLPSS